MTGFGLGGAMPNAIALTAEFTPKKYRSIAVTLMFCGFSIGAAVGGFVCGRPDRSLWLAIRVFCGWSCTHRDRPVGSGIAAGVHSVPALERRSGKPGCHLSGENFTR